MERRVILAITVMLGILILPSILWPPKKQANRLSGGLADSGYAVREPSSTSPNAPAPTATAPSAQPPNRPSAETVWVSSPSYRYGFSTNGGTLVAAELLDYQSFAKGDSSRRVQLIPQGSAALAHVLTNGNQSLSLADIRLTPSARSLRVGESGATLSFSGSVNGEPVSLDYRFTPDAYLFTVNGRVGGLEGSGAVLRLGLGDGLRSVEADSVDNFRNYALVTKATKTEKKSFASLKQGDSAVINGPFEWVGIKSKYFFLAATAFEEGDPPFGGAVMTGLSWTPAETKSLFGSRTSLIGTRAAVTVTLPVPPSGQFHYSVYAGPLEYKRLARLGHDLDDANPYGGFLRGLIQPVSVFVVNVLLWMHNNLHLAYGWVLILFGVLIRLLLWPLNQRAMASQLRMQAAQPLLQEVQNKYKNEPQKLQQEMMRLYKEYKINPVGGCLPMLLPMPVLFALFFVFGNTIEFRGVPFLWLPDLSRADPIFILPLLLGLSMYFLSKVGQKGLPPNPQAKTMLYVMPVMMTFIFLRLASGLNLYYSIQNLISVPQQYWLAQKRLREQGKPAK